MKPWEKYRDNLAKSIESQYQSEERGISALAWAIHKQGFNAATEYWQKKIEPLVEALEFYEDQFEDDAWEEWSCLMECDAKTGKEYKAGHFARQALRDYRKATQEEK